MSDTISPTSCLVHPPKIFERMTTLPDHWIFASQLTRQTLSVMLTTRTAPARQLAKLIYCFADDGYLCEQNADEELDAWRLLFQQAVAQVRHDEGLTWDAEVSL
jgi:hypothetical protein